MVREVESDDPALRCDFCVIEDVTELPAVSARSVQADQRNALAGLLIEYTIVSGEAGYTDIAPDDRFMGGISFRHRADPSV